MSPDTTRLPRYRRAITPPPMVLTERDEQIVEWVYKLRFATREQIQRLLFSAGAVSSCKLRLTLLYHNGYLDRRLLPFRAALGANRAVYCLDRRGAELLQFRRKTGAFELSWRSSDNNRELYFLEHMVAANDFRVHLTLAARTAGYDMQWTDERELRSRAMKQVVLDPKKPGQSLAVVPDGYFSLNVNGRQQGFALELDRATVEERPFREKIRALGEWKVTGAYQRALGTKSLRVLFVVASTHRDKRRLERIKAWTEAEGGESLFWFAELSDVLASAIFETTLWLVAGRNGLFRLTP